MTGTSSANPTKLRQYATDGMAMAGTLQLGAQGLQDAVDRLANAGGPVNGLSDFASAFVELGADWYHLDEFAGDVADGFFACQMGGPTRNGGVVEFPDDVLAELGQLGFADRQEAIDAAQAAATRLQDLIANGDFDSEAIQDLMADIGRGRFDPAFAVTFTEEIGVEGYVAAVGLIREAREPGFAGPREIEAVTTLATVLTTALDTVPDTPQTDRHDPSNHDLAPGERLDPDIVDDLVGYQPPDDDVEADVDLSVLLGLTDPPTAVAVDIANHRMSPLLAPNELGVGYYERSREFWGEHGGIVTNYADMLGRNPDASARWLADQPFEQGTNLELVLAAQGRDYVNDGQALARVVENGLTVPDDELRRSLMERSIDVIGQQDEIRIPGLYDAFVDGVEANMDVLADRATSSNPDNADALLNTRDFLSMLVEDTERAAHIYAATVDYASDQLAAVGTDPESGIRGAAENLGGVLGLLGEAEAHAAIGSAEEQLARQQALTEALTGAINLAPGGGLGGGAAKWGAREFVEAFEDPDVMSRAAEEASRARFATDSQTRALLAMHAVTSGQLDPGQVISSTGVDFFVPGEGPRAFVPLEDMTPAQEDAFWDWADSVYDSADPAVVETQRGMDVANDAVTRVQQVLEDQT